MMFVYMHLAVIGVVDRLIKLATYVDKCPLPMRLQVSVLYFGSVMKTLWLFQAYVCVCSFMFYCALMGQAA